MKKKECLRFFTGTLLMLAFATHSAQAAEGFRFPIGLSYVSNFNKVVDVYTDNLEFLGYTVSASSYAPVGLSFNPYYQFESGFAIGGGIGPIMAISSESYSFVDFPIILDVRYYIPASESIAPYVRAGARYHIASGDWVSGSSPGVMGGIGVEFLRNRRISAGIEVGYDAAEIELDRLRTHTTEKVRPGELMVSVFAVF